MQFAILTISKRVTRWHYEQSRAMRRRRRLVPEFPCLPGWAVAPLSPSPQPLAAADLLLLSTEFKDSPIYV